MSSHANVSFMFPICSACLSISHLKLFGSWQFIRLSSPGQGWAIIRPHQAWRGNHSGAFFFSHGVFSQWQARWLCVGSGCFAPLPSTGSVPGVELLWDTQIETGAETAGVSETSRSSICNNEASSASRRPATLSVCALQSRTKRYTWALAYNVAQDTHWPIIALSGEICTSTALVYCAADLFNHVASWEDARWLITRPVNVRKQRKENDYRGDDMFP